MDLKNVALHNAVAEPHPAFSGSLLARYPRNVRDKLNVGARLRGSDSTMAEVRFVTDAPRIRVTASSLDIDSLVRIYCGAFEHTCHALPAGQLAAFELEQPGFFDSVDRQQLHAGGWDPGVWRLVFDNSRSGIHEVDCIGYAMRPPRPDETPARRWLAYGSSITHSGFYSYTGFAARALNADVANKGLGGACHVEPEAADFLASLEWDFATLELGVNLRGQPQAREFFEARVRGMLKKLRATHPQQPIVLITAFTNRDRHMTPGNTQYAQMLVFFDDVLRKVVQSTEDANLHLIGGDVIVDDYSILGTDLLHPPAHGCARMGANLAKCLQPILEKAGI